VYSQSRAARLDRQARQLFESAAPAIQRLAAARGALRRMLEATREGVSGRLPADSAASAMLKQRAQLGEHLDRFIAGATAPTPLREHALQAMDTVEQRVVDIAADLSRGNLQSARAQRETLDTLAESADQAMESLVLWHASEASRDALELRRERRSTTMTSYALHGVAALVALVAMAIAFALARQTERIEHARQRAVEERNQLVEARAAELDAFASRVAHDIKSPLAAISLRVAVAQRQPNTREAALTRVHDGLRAIFPVVDDLLQFARSGGQPDREAVSALQPVLEAVTDEARPSLEELGAQLTVDDRSHAAIACPPGVLLSVLGNLVRNAVKFLPDGKEPRRLAIRASDGQARVRVEVEDSGPGIPSGQEQRIFERAVRGTTTRPGYGLGLATVKRLVTAYGGAVGVCPAVQLGGACFWFELPRATEDAA
jgi:signal transduction histidine kinase